MGAVEKKEYSKMDTQAELTYTEHLNRFSTSVSEEELWALFATMKKKYSVDTPQELIDKVISKEVVLDDSVVSKLGLIS
ncbi:MULTISPECIES: hypothetical protein [unclassified Halobacteriovorax]|uniref:hypothetical protein n=1 Tax=unclassified Halobacteriovorax TaxID=2639665 RepID=UPI00399A8FD6